MLDRIVQALALAFLAASIAVGGSAHWGHAAPHPSHCQREYGHSAGQANHWQTFCNN